MQETSLHVELKKIYAGGDPSRMEVSLDGYLIDAVIGDLLIEIQTGNFTALKPKLHKLLAHYPVRVVHPIALEKWIVKLPAESNLPVSRRKSPKRGRVEEIFRELVRIHPWVRNPNFSLEILLTREEEIRRDDGRGSWRRNGWSIEDRRLLDIADSVLFTCPEDYLNLLPQDLDERFTSRELAKAGKYPRYLAQKTLYCLYHLNLVERVARRGRAYVYHRLI